MYFICFRSGRTLTCVYFGPCLLDMCFLFQPIVSNICFISVRVLFDIGFYLGPFLLDMSLSSNLVSGLDVPARS